MKRTWNAIKAAVVDFLDDNAMTWAAAIAFYASLSFGPLLVLLLWATGFLGLEAQDALVGQFQQLMGPEATPALREILDNAETSPARGWAAIISFGVLLFSASGVFAQLQAALNAVFDVKAKPADSTTGSVWAYLRRRLLSMGMIASLLFILVVSLIASTVIQGASSAIGLDSETGTVMATLASLAVNLLVFTLLFAIMFKLLPDVRLTFHHTLAGAFVTALLFAVGKFGIGIYLGNASVGSSYGAAGSLVVLLVWVYYSAIILMIGAELTQAFAFLGQHPVRPDEHAVWADTDRPQPKRERGSNGPAPAPGADSEASRQATATKPA